MRLNDPLEKVFLRHFFSKSIYMSKKTLIQPDTNIYFTTTTLTNKPSFIQAKNKLIASAKRGK